MRVKPIAVRALEPYKIWVKFDDGVEGILDYSDIAGQGVFKVWEDPDFFKKVFIDNDLHVVSWPGELEFDRENMYMTITGLTWDQFKVMAN